MQQLEHPGLARGGPFLGHQGQTLLPCWLLSLSSHCFMEMGSFRRKPCLQGESENAGEVIERNFGKQP